MTSRIDIQNYFMKEPPFEHFQKLYQSKFFQNEPVTPRTDIFYIASPNSHLLKAINCTSKIESKVLRSQQIHPVRYPCLRDNSSLYQNHVTNEGGKCSACYPRLKQRIHLFNSTVRCADPAKTHRIRNQQQGTSQQEGRSAQECQNQYLLSRRNSHDNSLFAINYRTQSSKSNRRRKIKSGLLKMKERGMAAQIKVKSFDLYRNKDQNSLRNNSASKEVNPERQNSKELFKIQSKEIGNSSYFLPRETKDKKKFALSQFRRKWVKERDEDPKPKKKDELAPWAIKEEYY